MSRLFNGTSDFISADAAAGFSEQLPYSIAMWVNKPAAATRNVYTESSSSSGNPYFQLLNSTGGRLTVLIRKNTGTGNQVGVNTTNDAAGTCFDSTWHHICYTQDGAATCAWAVYIDGLLNISGSYTSGATTLNQIRIGCLQTTGAATQFYNGSLEDLGIFHRQLSAKEVLALASGLPASFLGPTHYWPIWGVDSSEPDLGNGAHVLGTLNGTSFAKGARIMPDLLRV